MAEHIQRHTVNNGHGEYFGTDILGAMTRILYQEYSNDSELISKYGAVLIWHDSKLALVPNPHSKNNSSILTAGLFMRDILHADESLRVVPHENYPEIRRKNQAFGMLTSRSTHPYQLKRLVDSLHLGRSAHLYLSSRNPTGESPDILTFSTQAPSPELYTPLTPLPVYFEHGRVKAPAPHIKTGRSSGKDKMRILRKVDSYSD